MTGDWHFVVSSNIPSILSIRTISYVSAKTAIIQTSRHKSVQTPKIEYPEILLNNVMIIFKMFVSINWRVTLQSESVFVLSYLLENGKIRYMSMSLHQPLSLEKIRKYMLVYTSLQSEMNGWLQ